MPLTGRIPASVGVCIATSLLMVTAACGSASSTPGAEPTPESSSASSRPDASTSGPTAAEPPVLPAEAQEDTVAGASAFARHYWATANHATETGDIAPLDALGTDDCAACADLEEAIVEVYDRGERVVGGLTDVQDVSPRPGDPVAGLVTKVLLRQANGQVAGEDGATLSTFEATEPFLIDMVLVWRGSQWTVNEWGSSSAP